MYHKSIVATIQECLITVNRTDVRVLRSRESLLDAALALLSENPAASLSDVAERAGVGRATLYRHFASREDLVRALARECLRRTDEDLAPVAEQGLTGRAALEAVIRRIMPLARQFHFLLSLWNVAEEDEQVREMYERQLDQLSALVDETKAEGAIDPSVSTAWVVASFDAQLAAAWWMIGRGLFTTEQAADAVIRALFDGVSPA